MIQETNIPGLLKDGDVYYYPNVHLPTNIERFMRGYNSDKNANYNTIGTHERWGYDARHRPQTHGNLTTKYYNGIGYVVNQYGKVLLMAKTDREAYTFVLSYKWYESGVELRGNDVYINDLRVDSRHADCSYSALDDLMKEYKDYTKDNWFFTAKTLAKDFLDDVASTYAEVIFRPFRNYLEATVLKDDDNNLIEPSTGLQFV